MQEKELKIQSMQKCKAISEDGRPRVSGFSEPVYEWKWDQAGTRREPRGAPCAQWGGGGVELTHKRAWMRPRRTSAARPESLGEGLRHSAGIPRPAQASIFPNDRQCVGEETANQPRGSTGFGGKGAVHGKESKSVFRVLKC